MKIQIEGWRHVPHSYGFVAEGYGAALAGKSGTEVKFREVPYFSAEVESQFARSGKRVENWLYELPTAGASDAPDVTLRFHVPLNLAPAATGRTLIFCTVEAGIAQPRLAAWAGLAALGAQADVALLTSSEWSRSGLIRSGADPDKVIVLHEGYDPERFHLPQPALRDKLRRERGWDGAFVFLNVGALTVNKGVVHLLKAFAAVAAEFPQVLLVLKGLDDLYRSQAALKEYLGALTPAEAALVEPRLQYLGETLSPTQVAELFQAVDVYVTPYHAEGFNRPVLEAAACGLPLICTAGGPTDEFTDPSFALQIDSLLEANVALGVSHACALIPNEEHLAQLMRRTMADGEWVRAAHPAAAAFVAERFTWRHVADRLLGVLNDGQHRCWRARPPAQSHMQAAAGVATAAVQTEYRRAIDLYSVGDRAAAGCICREILRREPSHAGTVYLLGTLALDEQHVEEAVLHFQLAVKLEPAEARYFHALGEAYRSLGRWNDAADSLAAAVCLDPSLAAAHHALGLTRLETGSTAQAIEDFRKAITLRPGSARDRLNLGRAWQLHGDVPAAIACYQEAIRLDPNYAIAHNNLGAALHVQGRSREAADHLRRALALRPDYPEAHYNLGNALLGMYEPAAAWNCYREALKLRPGYVNAQYQMGLVLEQLGRREEAVQVYEDLLARNPGHSRGWQRLGVMHMLRRMWDQAQTALERSVACDSATPEASPDLAYVRQMLCEWSTLADDRERLWTQAADKIERGQPGGVPPFFAIVLGWSAERQLALARAEAKSMATRHESLRQEMQLRHPVGDASGRLRIGYLSGDFYYHPVSHQTQAIFGLHNRSRFEIFTYSYGPDDGSMYRGRIQADSEHFIDVAQLTIKELAQRIAADGVHILIDMMGYAGFSRLDVMTLRPAPVQASWFSYPGTTGADFVDYVLGDRVVTPFDRAADFSEKLALLPHSFMPADHGQPIATVAVRRSDYGLPADGFVFCSLNNSYKFEPDMFGVWMRILGQVSHSVLWLMSGGATMEANLRREAQSRGVDPARIVFLRGSLPKAEHLARMPLADLFLDTYHYNAHVTAADALWTGVPVLTCPGRTFASRVAASLLTAVGLPELIADDFARYEQMAVHLARNPGDLAALRAKLAAQRTTWPLFDTPRFVRNLERAYSAMWQNHAAGNPPRQFAVAEN